MKFKLSTKKSNLMYNNDWTKWYAWHPVRISATEMAWLGWVERRATHQYRAGRELLGWECREAMCPVARRAMEQRQYEAERRMYEVDQIQDAVPEGMGRGAGRLGYNNLPQANPQDEALAF